MTRAATGDLPRSLLFACNHNAVRSPMAAGLVRHYYGGRVAVQSCGVRAAPLNPFAVAVMEEIGIDISDHTSRTFSDLEEAHFDVIISLTPEAQHQAVELTRRGDTEIVYWPTFDPSLASGNRDQILMAFRDVRDGLWQRIQDFLGRPMAPDV